MNTKKVEVIYWMLMSFVLVLISILHPRIIFIILAIGCMVGSIVCFKRKTAKTSVTISSLCLKLFGNLLAIIFICYLGQMLNVMFPYHAPYEYKKDIKLLKSEFEEKYYFFPDMIPDSATNVEWICSPGMMQGSGYHMLFMKLDKRYLRTIIDTFQQDATIYVWDDQYDWVNYDFERELLLGNCKNKIELSERKDVKIYVLYDNMKAESVHNAGFFVNETLGHICFFVQ